MKPEEVTGGQRPFRYLEAFLNTQLTLVIMEIKGHGDPQLGILKTL